MNNDFSRLVVAVIAWLSTVVAPSAFADVVAFDTFGPNNSFDQYRGYIIGGDGTTTSPYNYAQSNLFRPTTSGYVTSVSAAVYASIPTSSSPTPPMTLQIRADNFGSPGSLLESITSRGIATWCPQCNPQGPLPSSTAAFVLSGTTFLSANQNYWLGFTAPSTTDGTWNVNNMGLIGSRAYSGASFQQPGDWTVRPNDPLAAFRVEVNEATLSAIAPFSAPRAITLPGQAGTNRVTFDGSQFTVNVDIGLRGGIAPIDVRSDWERGIEGYWNRNGYSLSDSSGTYGLGFNVNFVDVGPVDFQVNVQNTPIGTLCRNDSLDWCVNTWVDTVAARNDMRGAVAAHEFGHLLGLYDEYFSNANDPGLNALERAELCLYRGPGNSIGIWCDSLMADYGPVQDRYLTDIVSFISSAAGNRNFVLGNNPLANPYPLSNPGPNFQGIIEGPIGGSATSVPEPSPWGLLCAGLLGVVACRRRNQLIRFMV